MQQQLLKSQLYNVETGHAPSKSCYCALYISGVVVKHRGTIHKTYTSAFPKQHFLYEQSQRNGNFFFKFNETVVGNNIRKEMAHMTADFFIVEIFQTTITRIVKQYHDQHDFRL